MAPSEIFLASLDDDGRGRARLVLQGDLDMASAPLFAEKLDKACEDRPLALHIDVTKLGYIDSSGFREFVRAAEICASNDTKLRIVGASRLVHQRFLLAGLGDQFFFEE